jgi:RNA ligase (TIGR02306 family)
MSTLRVTAEPLTILEHPNADALELAQVGLYRAVVGKGTYETGDYAVYIPEQAVLPPELIEELGLTGRLAGSAKNRVKAVRLRGELSQGIVCRPTVMDGIDLAHAHAEELDFAELLGITKWAPAVPASWSGTKGTPLGIPAPDLLPWTNIENLKRYPTAFEPGEPVVVTEKIHGTCCLVTYHAEDGRVQVSSKGVGGRGCSLIESDTNLYWRTIHGYDVPALAENLADWLGAARVGIFGEIYGAGVQDLTYGASAADGLPGYAVFDVSAEVGGQVRWFNPAEILPELMPQAPVLYTGPFDIDVVLKLAEGTETVSGKSLHLREGVVIRPAVERYSRVLGGRAIAKAVSDAYLTRKNGTEFE